MEEIWKDVKGYEGLYQVSLLGGFRNVKTKKNLSPQKIRGGYTAVKLYKNSVSKTINCHTLVAETFLGSARCPHCQSKLEVNHKNFNKADNSVSNLEYVTRQNNLKHSQKKKLEGMIKSSKLSVDDIKEIKNSTSSISSLCRRTGFTESSIRNIRSGKTWSDI